MSAPIRLRVATLNVWGLAEGLSRHLMPRMGAIGRALPAMALDVLALQESWTEEGRAALVAGARAAGLVHVWHRPEAFGGSGLVLCSKHPLRDTRFVRFQLNGHPERIDHGDYFGGKGVVLATIDTAAGPVEVLNTHLVARYTRGTLDDYHGHRAGQLIQIASALQAISRPVVALGDFNLTEPGVEHEILLGLTGLRDLAEALAQRQDTILSPHPYRPHLDRERIDYVLARDGASVHAEPVSITRVFDAPLELEGEVGAYSDHAGLLCEIDLLPGGSPHLPAVDAFEGARASARKALAFGEARSAARSRGFVGTSLAAGVATGALAWKTRSTRRQALRALGVGGAVLLGASGLGAAGLVLEARRRVPAAYAARREELERLRPPPALRAELERLQPPPALRSVAAAPTRR